MTATNVYNSISLAWAGDDALNQLLPATRVQYGRAVSEEDTGTDAEPQNPTPPYVFLEDVGEAKDGQTSKGRYFEQQIQITIVHENLSKAKATQLRMREVLDALAPVVEDGRLISWDRQAGGRSVEDGSLGRAFDTYVLLKLQNR